MDNNRRRSTRKSSSDIIGGHWLPSVLIWGGVLLMLTGGVIAYPTINGYLTQPEAASLEFSVTFTPASTSPGSTGPTAAK